MKKKYTIPNYIGENLFFYTLSVQSNIPAAQDPNFQAEEQDMSTFKQLNMHCNLELCEDENGSIVLSWRSPSLFGRILFHHWNAFASRSL